MRENTREKKPDQAKRREGKGVPGDSWEVAVDTSVLLGTGFQEKEELSTHLLFLSI